MLNSPSHVYRTGAKSGCKDTLNKVFRQTFIQNLYQFLSHPP
jgi:hypothetical protein